MSEKAYVHNDVTLTCTNGFKTSKLLVKDRNVKISNGKLIATIEDKPCNFACKWAGVLAAIVAALCIAAPFIVAVLAAFVIGMVASLTIGQLLCWVALRGSNWTKFHPRVNVQGKKALVETSELKCLIFSGSIKIFYDDKTAEQELRNNQLRNTVEIFGAAFIGRAFFSAVSTGGWGSAVKGFLVNIPKNLLLGYGIVEGSNILSNITTGRDWNDNIGGSVYKNGDNGYESTTTEGDYGKLVTEPIDKGSEVKVTVNDKMNKAQNPLNDFEVRKQDQFKSKNPIHRYSRGRKSPHYGRQQQQRQKLNNRARNYASTQRSRLSERYQNRVQSVTEKNYTRANYGLLGFFAISEVIAQHMSKTLENSLQNANHPENQSRASTKVFATTL